MSRSALQTSLVVIQPTSFCNIDCRYCYLVDRDVHEPMSIDTVRAIRDWLDESGLLGDKVTVCWHAGEPLVLPAAFFAEAFDEFSKLEASGCRVHHSIQTNGTLATDAHCEVFVRHRLNVGISIDGPKFIHDRNRVTRKGAGTFDAANAGLNRFLAHGISVSAISVVSSHTLAHSHAFYDAFVDMRIPVVGLNVEEIEGVNLISYIRSRSDFDAYKDFLRDLLKRSCDDGRVAFREFNHALRSVYRADFEQISSEATPFHIVSFDHFGNFSTFSPELLDQTCEPYGRLQFGNARDVPFSKLETQARYRRVAAEVEAGVERCAQECEYFGVCGGGAPSNKLAEHGTFDCARTDFCDYARKAVFDVVVEAIESDPDLIERASRHGWWNDYVLTD
ncbi:cyclophane-forming radical SAM/SPASM peptide maturase GrrM/OscB [Caballeronia novacaledonica]|nr:cyclophane-forming radical SAM/SPASM peptide maturase GrrM/OscB [Caballeronia novacaledonica]